MAMRPRQINYLRHQLTARQSLSILLECWRESRSNPVILIAPTGACETVIRSIRVILSKERKAASRKSAFGFVISNVFPYTDNGIKGEAVVVYWRLTSLQNLKNLDIIKNVEAHMNGMGKPNKGLASMKGIEELFDGK